VSGNRVRLRGVGPELAARAWESDRLLRIGRLADFEVALTDTSVSRQHAEVALGPEGWVVRDLGSTNGTFLNGARLAWVGQRLRAGDVVQCGNVLFRVELGGDPQAPDRALQVECALRQSWEDVARSLQPGTVPAHPLLPVLQFGRDCLHGGSLDAFLEAVLWQAAEALQANAGCAALLDATTGRFTVRAEFSCGRPVPTETWLGGSFIPEALVSGKSLLCRPVPGGAAEQAPGLRSVVCALLGAAQKPLGALCLARTFDPRAFTPQDLSLADALALSVSGAVDNLQQAQEREQNNLVHTLTAFVHIVELRRGRVGPRHSRVTAYALLLAEELKLSAAECHLLRTGAPLIELGKVTLPDAVLQKPGPLTPAEWADVHAAVLQGAALLEMLPDLAPLLPVVRNHNERWDGTGYPDGLAGEQTPLLARVVAVAHAFDVMTRDRPHAPCRTPEEAFAEMERGAGTQFDPACVGAFLRLRPRILRLLDERASLQRTFYGAELERVWRSGGSSGWAAKESDREPAGATDTAPTWRARPAGAADPAQGEGTLPG
jgi:hypothetical protein